MSLDPAAKELGCLSNIEVIGQFTELEGKRVMDIGCGAMTFTRQIAEAGATVVGIDPDPFQAELNRKAELPPNISFEECDATQLPVRDSSVDGVFFAYSLHHIPKAVYGEVFSEVARALKPDGFLYVIEPADCPLNQVMKLFHDEDKQRREALLGIQEIASPMFQSHKVVKYHSFRQFESFDDFAAKFGSRTFNTDYSMDDVRRSAVQEAFELHGAPDYSFEAPKRVDFLKALKL